MKKVALTIGGDPITTSETFEVINPATESVVGRCPAGSPELLERAVEAARAAFPSWAGTADAERAAKLMEIGALLENHQAELAEMITLEQGKPLSGPGSNFEVAGAVAWTRTTAGLQLQDEVIQRDAKASIVVRRKPVGVIGSITPWNWPLLIATWHVMPALRAGCTVVIKPSPLAPLAVLRMIELMNRVLPPGVVNSVSGAASVGEFMSTHPRIDKITFTGSTETGRRIMNAASGTLKRLTLELGGNDAGIILPDTDIEPLLEKLFWGCFINAGQTCAALKRLYVHEGRYEEVVERLAAFVATIPVGDGLDPRSLIGPLSNRMQLEKVVSYVADARARGARVAVGGERSAQRGYFHPITVIADATEDMQVVREEQFGPVIPVLKYRSVDEAVERANALDTGLGGSVWGADPDEASRIATRLECGTAWVNQHGTLHPLAPFGGVKRSGIGVEFNIDGLKEYTTVQVLNVAR